MEFQYDQYEKLEDSINKMFSEKPIKYNLIRKNMNSKQAGSGGKIDKGLFVT